MNDLRQYAVNVLFAIPTWLGPCLFLIPASAQLNRSTKRLWLAWGAALFMYALLATAGWLVTPDHSGMPVAAIASEMVLVAPALAITAVILQLTQGAALARHHRLLLAGAVGTATLLVFLTPAVLVSAALGGHEWGSPC